MITLLLTLIEPAIGPTLDTFACVFGVRASVFTIDLAQAEIAGKTSIGGGLCILGVLAEPPSAAKAMAVSK